jgi:hypothetical protein
MAKRCVNYRICLKKIKYFEKLETHYYLKTIVIQWTLLENKSEVELLKLVMEITIC